MNAGNLNSDILAPDIDWSIFLSSGFHGGLLSLNLGPLSPWVSYRPGPASRKESIIEFQMPHLVFFAPLQ